MEHKREPIKYHTITHRWGNDAFCKDFSGHLEKWLQQFSEDERSLMLILLKNFYYYTSERLNSKVVIVKIMRKLFFVGLRKILV